MTTTETAPPVAPDWVKLDELLLQVMKWESLEPDECDPDVGFAVDILHATMVEHDPDRLVGGVIHSFAWLLTYYSGAYADDLSPPVRERLTAISDAAGDVEKLWEDVEAPMGQRQSAVAA